jgi:Flp pilus assembly pilin Flp
MKFFPVRVYTQFVTRDLFRDEDGQTMSEYAVILAVISVAVITVLGVLSGNIQAVLSRIADAIN